MTYYSNLSFLNMFKKKKNSVHIRQITTMVCYVWNSEIMILLCLIQMHYWVQIRFVMFLNYNFNSAKWLNHDVENSLNSTSFLKLFDFVVREPYLSTWTVGHSLQSIINMWKKIGQNLNLLLVRQLMWEDFEQYPIYVMLRNKNP